MTTSRFNSDLSGWFRFCFTQLFGKNVFYIKSWKREQKIIPAARESVNRRRTETPVIFPGLDDAGCLYSVFCSKIIAAGWKLSTGFRRVHRNNSGQYEGHVRRQLSAFVPSECELSSSWRLAIPPSLSSILDVVSPDCSNSFLIAFFSFALAIRSNSCDSYANQCTKLSTS